VDTHCHLDDPRFAQDLPTVLERAAAAGVICTITAGTTAASSQACVSLAAQHSSLRAAVGIQPNHVAEAQPSDWDQILLLARADQVVALGETGLDRYWDFTPLPQQEDFFVRHLELARKLNLALIIHCRQAEAEVLRLLREDFDKHGPVRGVMHSFSGTQATAAACLDMGLFLSFAGMLTYKNAQELRDVARTVPQDRLLLETDSPYLAPAPVRGRRNEPAFVSHTLELLAVVRGQKPETLAGQTTRNACALFGLAPMNFGVQIR
jgi:TatD DNase family protein